jgi:hypothetical protein
LPPVPDDDGKVVIRGHLVDVSFAEWNAQYHMEGFDELPKAARDRINYAPTPEEGALPTRDLLSAERTKALAEAQRVLRELLTNTDEKA